MNLDDLPTTSLCNELRARLLARAEADMAVAEVQRAVLRRLDEPVDGKPPTPEHRCFLLDAMTSRLVATDA